jgi:chemotaxis protein MotA
MFVIIGSVVVLGGVIGGYVLHHGNLSILFQPTELLIIGGAALGSFIISSPMKVLTQVIKGTMRVFTAKGHSKNDFLEILGALNVIFTKMRKEGIMPSVSSVITSRSSYRPMSPPLSLKILWNLRWKPIIIRR